MREETVLASWYNAQDESCKVTNPICLTVGASYPSQLVWSLCVHKVDINSCAAINKRVVDKVTLTNKDDD